MKYAFFEGCKVRGALPQYGKATRAVLKALGVKLVDLPFGCCGYPAREQSELAFALSSARALALAERRGLDIVTPCKCCFGNIKHAEHALASDPGLRRDVDRLLAEESLSWKGRARCLHVLTVLDEELPEGTLEAKVVRKLDGARVAAHYGCHALRPSYITRFDHPLAPTIFERLLEKLGAEGVDWYRRLECCGRPLADRNPELSNELALSKRRSARDAGAHVMATACTWCQLQLADAPPARSETPNCADSAPSADVPVLPFVQLVGWALGLSDRATGADPSVIKGLFRD